MRQIARVMYFYRVLSSLAFDQLCRKEIRKSAAIGRCGHSHKPQFRAHIALNIQAKTKSGVQIQRALMHFVEQYRTDPLKQRVPQKAA
ncbi:hypothetical protein AA106555_0709 [Neokomagataea thailandica NBRC 106555]|uniref:Transposase n=1 Tax=Neokomagataea thailandica NBRC 106555 TaxID=1223520 RepID=A0ABQ0QNX5_9PROT|nr:hypothetical protein AA106555_0709 [Neokomagataea thailandica NBRC 106555]